jgi:hypothetical protein
MTILKVNNFLMLGASGVSLLLAAVLLGTGQLPFSGLFLGVGLLLLFLWLKSRKGSQENVKPSSP